MPNVRQVYLTDLSYGSERLFKYFPLWLRGFKALERVTVKPTDSTVSDQPPTGDSREEKMFADMMHRISRNTGVLGVVTSRYELSDYFQSHVWEWRANAGSTMDWRHKGIARRFRPERTWWKNDNLQLGSKDTHAMLGFENNMFSLQDWHLSRGFSHHDYLDPDSWCQLGSCLAIYNRGAGAGGW